MRKDVDSQPCFIPKIVFFVQQFVTKIKSSEIRFKFKGKFFI